MTRSPPELFTERLVLSAPRPDDLSDSLAMWSSPEVTRFIGGQPSTKEEVWARLLRYAGLWSLLGIGYWIVRERHSNNYVGEVGFADFRRDMEPGLGSDPEIGWALTPQVWGRGYAREAVRAVIDWADELCVAPSLVCIIAPQNSRSIRLAEQFQFELQTHATYKKSTMLVYRRAQGPDETALIKPS